MLNHVIANQCAHWCGNLLVQSIEMHCKTNTVPGDCHVGSSSLLAITWWGRLCGKFQFISLFIYEVLHTFI